MRPEPNPLIEPFRREHPYLGTGMPGTNEGFFVLRDLAIVSSGIARDTGWEHVSVSCVAYIKQRCPTWEEMCQVKNLFWSEEETVVQFHPKKSEYVNNHEYVLHLWKQIGKEYILPPLQLV